MAKPFRRGLYPGEIFTYPDGSRWEWKTIYRPDGSIGKQNWNQLNGPTSNKELSSDFLKPKEGFGNVIGIGTDDVLFQTDGKGNVIGASGFGLDANDINTKPLEEIMQVEEGVLEDFNDDGGFSTPGGFIYPPTKWSIPIPMKIHLNVLVDKTFGPHTLFVNGQVSSDTSFTYTDNELSDGVTFTVKYGGGWSRIQYYIVQKGKRLVELYSTEYDESGVSGGRKRVVSFLKDTIYSLVFKGMYSEYKEPSDPIELPLPEDPIPPIIQDTPTISVSPKTFTYNLNERRGHKIQWRTNFADKVVYSLGKVKKDLPASGELVLTAQDFPNGVGQYTIYLQPESKLAGSGTYETIVVNVLSKVGFPGPDITHIDYPENIIGADFKGYDVDFGINWSSINTNWVDVWVGKVSSRTQIAKKLPAQGGLTLKVSNVLKTAGFNIESDPDFVDFKLLLAPSNSEGDTIARGKVEEIKIRFDKSNLKLRRNKVIGDIKESICGLFDKSILKQDNSKYLTHLLHFGNGKNKLISTWDIDTETFSEYTIVNEATGEERKTKEEKSLVLKLYEPLGGEIQPNQQVWISKVQSIPLIETMTIINEGDDECIVLKPNFNEEYVDDLGLQIYDDIISSGSATSTEIINQYVSGSGFDLSSLDIQFVSSSYSIVDNGTGQIKQKSGESIWYSNFVKYSSAEERIENFWYKIKLIEFYNERLSLITSGSHYTSTVALSNEKTKIDYKINEIKQNFDSFEKFLYTSSSVSGITYPGAGLNEVSASTSTDGLTWYSSAKAEAYNYDKNNDSRLVNNLPNHVKNSDEGQEFVLFFDMISQHFDILWVYTKTLAERKKLEHKNSVGIKDTLIYQMLESLGWDADIGLKSSALWDFAFGKDTDGTQVRAKKGKDRQNETWRRILNNLPYLLKHKGTKRAVNALMACYGVPASLLTITEYGGPRDVTQSGTTKFTYEDRTAAINISGSAAITIPWKTYTTDYPNSVEIRLNSDQKKNQKILSGDSWSLDVIKDTGSLAKFKLTVGSQSSTTSTMPFFNDEYTQIVVNRVTGSTGDTFTLYAKEGFQERIRNEVSTTLSATTKAWTSGSELTIGGSTLTGSIDEFRLWRTALNETNIENHTLLPDAIDGNSPSASTEDLIFRLDFEYPKNRFSDTSIKNVSITTTYGTYATASNFDNNTSYPYQYTTYDRTVTANVPSSGTSFGNKFRFETQYEHGSSTALTPTSSLDLSYRQRVTKKSFDTAPVDTNKLGFFFSPIKEINLDILKSVGPINIDDYIGDPSDNYNDEYTALKTFRDYYFERFNLNFNEYVQLVRYIDKSLFDQLESLVPARAQMAKGLLLEPHILERSKTRWNRPSGEENYHEVSVDTTDDISITSTNSNYLTVISASEDTVLSGQNISYVGHLSESNDSRVSTEILNYNGTYQNQDDLSVSGLITRNQNSTGASIELNIDAKITGSLLDSFYQSNGYESIGMDSDGLSRLGFNLYGENSYSIRTRFDGRGNLVKDKVRVFRIKESYSENEIVNSDSNDSSRGTESVSVTKYKQKVVILSQSGSAPSVSGNVVEVEPLNGHFTTHYRNVGDLTTGLENSYFNGSKQTSATTLDGGSPVQTFTTNPNTLRVSDSGRGSGEPILEVD